MVRLAKYLKPFVPGMLAAIALLFMQVLCELNLPNMMSDVVTVGITQGGIEQPAPEAISRPAMEFLQLFMTETQVQTTENAYTLTDPSEISPSGKAYREIYPKAEGQFWLRKPLSGEERAPVDEAFSEAASILVTFLSDAAGNAGDGSSTAASEEEWDFAENLETLQPLLEWALRLQSDFLETYREKAAGIDPSLQSSMAIAIHRSVLTELGADLTAIQQSSILRRGLWMLLIALLGGAASVLVSFLASRVGTGFARELRRAVFEKVGSFSRGEFDRFSTASLITRSTNDVTQVQMLMTMGLRMICFAPLMGIGGIIMALRKSVSMSWIIGLACVVLLGIFVVVLAVALPKFTAIQSLIDRLNLVSRENLSGLMVIRAFGAQEREIERFDKANRDLAETNLFIHRIMVMMWPVMMLLVNGASLLIIWVGGHQIAESGMPIGDMMAYIQYTFHVIMSFLIVSMIFVFVPRAAVSGKRIAEVLNCEISVRDPEVPKAFPSDGNGHIEFRNVGFRYYGAECDALQGISFTALPGQTTAIIGSTGSGKSTVVSLMLRFYDVTEGAVLVDGMDVREISQHALRDKIGYVPQKGVLMSGTIRDNIAYGTDGISQAELEKAAEVAQAADFIEKKEGGFDALIAQGGDNVSGGQRQRLSIARALAKNPQIFIFDDSFSALDYTTDAALRKALRQHTGQSTVIIVAQRVSTIMDADQILVFDEGRLAGKGTHKTLLTDCPEYYEIASSQLSEEELGRGDSR